MFHSSLSHKTFIENLHHSTDMAGPIIKYVMDKTGAIVGLTLFAPIFAILYYKVTRDGGPAFYAQERIGRGGKKFKCWKFRTMVMDSEQQLQELLAKDPDARKEWEENYKLKNDPRITKLGHFLRKTSLDELPQFYNVLRGDMSIVGPRPIVEEELVYYGNKAVDYLSVNPGITGPWQVNGRSDTTYEERVAMDSAYAKEWSFWQDIKIIFQTIYVVLGKHGAY